MLVLAIVSGAIVLWWLVLAACLPLGLRLVPPIPTDVRPRTFPARVSVIVPARNEEEALPRCLASLAAQDMAPLEVLVVDDDSTDGTRAIAEAAGVGVVVPPKRPPGWMGKTWAAWQGSQSARGDLGGGFTERRAFLAITAPCVASSQSDFARNRRPVGAAERC